ncbi:hypothetical protein [Enterovirga rhinocerotis]|uniref:Uncharacterized protein n=1 Tax=Enterovirga rhinocerotis TaxID=1339210 RepID=A0A4R7BS59_9HYPH|nr:hypothetical protein [Enterovirga rhinocerotis]TDR88093.1 hypothetical protein EV668_3961 [Enterovirga rhinocerotis]
MSGSRLIVTTVLCSALGSVGLMAIYSHLVGLYMPATAWVFTALAPIVVSTPISVYLVR